MGIIFISYRREESRGDAGRLYDRLALHFGKKQLFRDVDAIAPGDRFPEILNEKLKTCDVLLAVIGPKWLTVRQGKLRRLDDPADYVRREIAAALERKIPVIPVLVGKAFMPRAQELPPALESLGSCQAAELREDRFHADVDELIKRIAALAEGVKVQRAGRLVDPVRPWLLRDDDWLSKTEEPICPPLILEWPTQAKLQVTSNGGSALSANLRRLLDQMLQRLWQLKGVLVPGVCMKETPCGGDECIVRVFSSPVAREQQWEPLECPVRVLESQIEQHVHRLIGHQECADLVAIHAPDDLSEITSTKGVLTDLVLVCRALLAERASLTAFKSILEFFLRLRRSRQPLVDIVEEIRATKEVRASLPGNGAGCCFVALTPDFEQAISASLDYAGSQPVLSMEAEVVQQAIQSFRAIDGVGGLVVVLVKKPAIRPFVRKLVNVEFSNLHVMSQREVLPQAGGKVVRTISLNG
jgi:hypothetical protein